MLKKFSLLGFTFSSFLFIYFLKELKLNWKTPKKKNNHHKQKAQGESFKKKFNYFSSPSLNVFKVICQNLTQFKLIEFVLLLQDKAKSNRLVFVYSQCLLFLYIYFLIFEFMLYIFVRI